MPKLESFCGVFGLVLSHLGLSWARFWALRVAFWNPITLYAHQLINASTLQPVPHQHFVTRAGGLRAERLNKEIINVLIHCLIPLFWGPPRGDGPSESARLPSSGQHYSFDFVRHKSAP